MKTNIKTLGLKAVILCLFLICSSSLIAQNSTIESISENEPITEEFTNYSLQSNFNSTTQGGNIVFVPTNDDEFRIVNSTLFDWSVYDSNGNEIASYYNQTTAYYRITFNHPPGTYSVQVYFRGGSDTGVAYKTVTVVTP